MEFICIGKYVFREFYIANDHDDTKINHDDNVE